MTTPAPLVITPRPVYHSHGIDFAGCFRTVGGQHVAACTCGWASPPVADNGLALDAWRSHRWEMIK